MMIEFSELAAKKIKEYADDGGDTYCVRAKIQGGGCAGFTYDLSFYSGKFDNDDEKFVSHGVMIVVDQVSLQYLDGCVIDYVEDPLGMSGFKFVNPRATGSCGCGNSVSF